MHCSAGGCRLSAMYRANDKRYETMQFRRAGKSGLLLPAVSLGFWHNFGDSASYENMKHICFAAFDGGITHFDLANNYGPAPGSAELHAGRIIRENFLPYRDELVISTKAGYDMWPGPYGNWGSRKYLLASLDQSLRRLGLDYVDIFYHHRMDPILDELHCPFVINQNRYSIFDRGIEQNGLKETAARLGKGLITYSPLAQGLLTDRYLASIPADSRVRTDGRFLTEDAITPQRVGQIRRLNEIALRRGQTLAEMALAWILRDDSVTSVLVGASKPSQVLTNLRCIQNTVFSAEELAEIDAVSAEA